MYPPVGKSGPLTCFMSFSTSVSGSSIIPTIASTTSASRCGGMFVAMPTAIPADPLINKFGSLAGKTVGSDSDPS